MHDIKSRCGDSSILSSFLICSATTAVHHVHDTAFLQIFYQQTQVQYQYAFITNLKICTNINITSLYDII